MVRHSPALNDVLTNEPTRHEDEPSVGLGFQVNLVLGVRPDTGGKRVDGANNHRFDAHARASGDRGDETDPIEPVVDLPNRPVEVGDATRCLGEQREQEETVRDGPAWGIRGVDVLMVVCALGKGVDPGLVDGNPGVTGRRGKDSARGVR